jgi:hypothetical protein
MTPSFDSTALFSTTMTSISSVSIDGSKNNNLKHLRNGDKRSICKDVYGKEINIRLPYRYT